MAIYLYRHTDTTDTNTDTATPASVVQTVGVAFVIIEHRELNIAFTPPIPFCWFWSAICSTG